MALITQEAPKKETKQEKKGEASSSSSDSDAEPETLSKADIEKIKKLISEQDKEIETLKEQVKQYKEKLVYQLAENDNTIKRYKKEIDSTKEFAISKFAKDLLDVRDNLELAEVHIKKIKIDEVKDIQELKKQFLEI